MLRIVFNILWLVLAGWWLALSYVAAGIISFMLIITIPFGIQSFKLAGYALWPFGRAVVARPDRDLGLSTVGNVLWFLIAGLWLALGHLLAGILLVITIIGLPLGVASFKMAGAAIAPFGKRIVSVKDARAEGMTILVSVEQTSR